MATKRLTQQVQPPYVCTVEECGRRVSARGLCQTHHRQMQLDGKVKPIRRYRRRRAGTVKFSGLRLTPHCVAVVKAYARRRGISAGAAIAEILEEWNAERPEAPGES